MKWEAIAAIGQMLGSIAVFITLVYLSVQTNHARLEVRRAARSSRADNLRDMFVATRLMNLPLAELNVKTSSALGAPISGDPRFPFIAALMSRTGATEAEAALLHFEQMAWFQLQIQASLDLQELSQGEVASLEGNIRRTYGGDGIGALWYRTTKHILNPDAVR